MSQDNIFLNVPAEKPGVGGGLCHGGGVNTGMAMDGASYFSLGNEQSVVEMPALPAWMINTPMHSKLPMIDAPKGKYILFTTGLCEKLDCTPSDLDFDASPQTISVQYKSLHDPHLKWHYTRTSVYKRLVKNGFITSDGKVICTLKEFNEYHQYLKQIRLSKIKQDRKRMMEEKQKEKMKSGIKNGVPENIRDIRAREARERKKKQEEEKETRLNDMLSIEKLRYIRLEEKLRLKQKHKKTCMKMAQDKINGLKAQQAMEERKRKTKLLRKRGSDDKKRAETLEQNRCTKREERENKLEQKWNLRERLREMRLLGEMAEQERRQLKMAKDIAERDAAVEQTRARQKGIFQKIQESRSMQIKEREGIFARRLDVKLKKVQERFQKRTHPQKVARPKAANSSRRSRFSSTWSLERTLGSPDFKPCDDSLIKKLKDEQSVETEPTTETHDTESGEIDDTQTSHSRKSSTHSSVNSKTSTYSSINSKTSTHSSANSKTSTHSSINSKTSAHSSINSKTSAHSSINSKTSAHSSINSKTSAHSSINKTLSDNSETNVDLRKTSVSSSYAATDDEEDAFQPKSVDSLARGLVCNILQNVAEEEGYDGYYLSPELSPGGSDKDIANRSLIVDANGGSDGEDDWYVAANNIVGNAIDSAIEYLENNPAFEEPSQGGRMSPDTVVRDNIRRQSIILSSVLNMMDDTGLDLHYVSSSEGNVTDAEDEDEEDIMGIIDNTASSTSGDGDWQGPASPEHSPVPPPNNAFSGTRRRSVNEAILAPDTLRGFHELEAERATTSEGALRLGGNMRRMSFEERHVQRRHTVPDIVPIFNDIQLNIDKNTVDSNLCAISIRPNDSTQMAHTAIERNSFRDLFKPDMTNCKGTADCLRGVLTQQLSQRRASLRYGDLQHAHDVLVENPEEDLHHEEHVMSVDDVDGLCHLPQKRTHCQPHTLEDVSENVTEEVPEDESVDDEELDMFADQMVSDVLKRVQGEEPVNQESERSADIHLGEDCVLHTTHHVHAEVINGTDDSPGVVISTVSTRSRDVDDVEWYNEWLPGAKKSQDGKSTGSRTSKRTLSKEPSTKSKTSSRSSVKRRRTSASSRVSKRSNSAKSFKEALRTNSGKTRVVSSEPIKPTTLTSDESGSSINSRSRRRSESFISRFVSSVRDFFTSSRHRTSDDESSVTSETNDVHISIQDDHRIKSLEIIETQNHDSLDNQTTQSMDEDSQKDTKNSTEVDPETKSIENPSKSEVDSVLKQSTIEVTKEAEPSSHASEIDVDKDSTVTGEPVLAESVNITDKTTSNEIIDEDQKEAKCSKTGLNDESGVSETSCVSAAVGTKNDITTDEIDAIRNALQPCKTGTPDISESNKPSKTPPVSSTALKEKGSSQKEDKLSRKSSIEKKTSRPRPPSKNREHSSSSSLRRPVLKGSSHRKVKSEVCATIEATTSSSSSATRHSTSGNKREGRKPSDSHRSSTASIETAYVGKPKSRSSKNSSTSGPKLDNCQNGTASRKVSGKVSKDEGSSVVDPDLIEKSGSDVGAKRLTSTGSMATDSNIASKMSEDSQNVVPVNTSAAPSHTSAKGKGNSMVSSNQSRHSSVKTKSKSSRVSSESKSAMNSSLHGESRSQSISSNVQSTVRKVESADHSPSSVRSTSRRTSSTKAKSSTSSSTAKTRKLSSRGGSVSISNAQSRTSSQRTTDNRSNLNIKTSSKSGVNSDKNNSATSCQSSQSHGKSVLTVQSKTSSQRTDNERPNLNVKTSSTNGVNTINDKNESSISCKSAKSHQASVIDAVQSKTLSQRSDIGRPDLGVKTSSTTEVNTINDKNDSSTSCQSARSHQQESVVNAVQSKTSSQHTDNEAPFIDAKTSSTTGVNTINDKTDSSTSCKSARSHQQERVVNAIQSKTSSQHTDNETPVIDVKTSSTTEVNTVKDKNDSSTSCKSARSHQQECVVHAVQSKTSSQHTDNETPFIDVKTSSTTEINTVKDKNDSSTSCQSKTSSQRTSNEKPDVKTSSKDNVNAMSDRKESSTSYQSARSHQENEPNRIQSKASSQHTYKEKLDIGVKRSSKDEINISNVKNDSSTRSHQGSKTSKIQSKTSSRRTVNGIPDFDVKTSSTDKIKKESSTSCQSATDTQDNALDTILPRTSSQHTNNDRPDIREKSLSEELDIEPISSLSSKSLKEKVEERTEVDDTTEKSPEDLNTSDIDESAGQQGSVESISSASKSPSGRLLSRPQSDQNRLRLVNEADAIATSEVTDSVLSTVRNLPEISRPSSAEIVLNTTNFDSKSQIALELERPKSPEPPIDNKESVDVISPNN